MTGGSLPLGRRAVSRLHRLVADELPAYGQSLHPLRQSGCVIFAQGRTGTWLLHSLLNQHPQLHFDKEILQDRVLAPKLYVIGRARAADPRMYGCHVQIDQLLNTQRIDARQFIHHFAGLGWKIIALSRQDIVRQSISAILAVQRGKWVAHDAVSYNSSGISIDIDRVIKRIERRQLHLDQERKILAKIPHLSLIYERDLQQQNAHQSTADKIFGYLGIPKVDVVAKTHRISPANLESVVRNFDELMARISAAFPELVEAPC